MRKDTSKLIDLDALFAKAESKQLKETLKESAMAGNVPPEVAARIDLVNKFNFTTHEVDRMSSDEALEEYNKRSSLKESIDIDSILMEWSYRCDKGYPDFNNKHDMIKLQEILDEMGVASPFKRITEASSVKSKWNDLKSGTANEKAFKQKLVANTKQLNFENESIYQDVFEKFTEMDESTQKTVINKFQSMNVDDFANNGWKPFEGFFDARGDGGVLPGRGEMMAVLAIKGASSGGSKNKDLQIPGGSWEIKEAPDSIRMAKSGGIGKFEYVDLAKDFYRLLTNIGLNTPTKDKLLKRNLSKVFSDPSMATDVYNTLINNFRGDAFKPTKEDLADNDETTKENFFDRTKTSEWPTGVIELHFKGFKALKIARDEVIENKDLINNAKLILRTSRQDDKEFYINPEDSDEIATAKPGKEVKIKVAAPAKGDLVEFLQNMLLIMKHPLVVDPNRIPKDFIKVRDSYILSSNIEGILYYNKGKNKGLDPTPHLGRRTDWIIYGISAGNGKMQRAETTKRSKVEWLQAQLKFNK